MRESFRIATARDGSGDWLVLAHWHGSERAIFRGTLYGAIAHAARTF